MIFHIDVSNHYNQNNYTIVSLVNINSNIKKGIVIEDPLRKKLLNHYTALEIHSVLISILLEGLPHIKKIIICPDITPVSKLINLICEFRDDLVLGKLKSLNELREEIGDFSYKSEADAFARNINRNFKKKHNQHRRKTYFDDGSVIIISEDKSTLDILLKRLEKLKEI